MQLNHAHVTHVLKSLFFFIEIVEYYYCRYENQVRDNSGIQTSYAYDVDGQKVQVARLDPVYYNKY